MTMFQIKVADKINPVLYSITFSPLEIISLSTAKYGGRVATFPPPDRLVILRNFFQSRRNGYTGVKWPSLNYDTSTMWDDPSKHF